MAPRRLARLIRAARRAGLTHVLISRPENVEYLTGFKATTNPPREAHLLVDVEEGSWRLMVTPLDHGEAVEALGARRVRRLIAGSLPRTLSAALRGAKGVLGAELGHLSYRVVEEVRRRLEGWRIEDFTGRVEELRAVKEPEELELIRGAVRVAELALERGLEALRVGVEEAAVARVIEEEARRLGCESMAFDVIVGSGPNSAYPHKPPSERRVERGDVVVVDVGVRFKGYCSDLTRTVLVGEVDPRLRGALEASIEALEEAERELRDGVRASRVDRAAREVFRRRGLHRRFIHGLGHGVGLSVHEGPSISPRSRDRIRRGNVVTLEPGLYFDGLGGVRVEDMYYVAGPRAERLTTRLERWIEA